MAYSATLANSRGLLNDTDYKRILDLFSKAGLSMDHHQFDEDCLEKATTAILKTRDGKLRLAVPSPLGECVFINDVPMSELHSVLRKHKEIVKTYPRKGEGLDAFVDSSDTGYTMNNKPVEMTMNGKNKNGASNGVVVHDDAQDGVMNGIANGGAIKDPATKKANNSIHNASAEEEIHGLQKNGMPANIQVYVNGSNGNGTNGSAH